MASTLTIDLRPRNFDEVIGLEDEVAALRNKISSGSIPRAFIFTGPFGCGKSTLALITAKEIQGWDFAGKPQVQELNAANFTGIDAMRALVREANTYPQVGKYNVIILDEAHKLSKPAQELLLKEFEVPDQPTVWIIATTDPEKLIEGIRAGRCFTIPVRGMDDAHRLRLIQRAAQELQHDGDVADFVAAVVKAKIVSPRKILMAFEAYHAGIPAVQAVNALSFEMLPEYFEIAMGVVFGLWDKPYTLPWMKEKDGSPRKYKSVGEQLKALDDRLKRKPKDENATPADSEDEEIIDAEDVQGRPEASRALRAIVAASLRNQVYKSGAKAVKAAKALQILAHCTSPNPFDAGMEFALTIGGLYRANVEMRTS